MAQNHDLPIGGASSLLCLDKADVPAAFHPRNFDSAQIFASRIKKQVFLKIMLSDVIRPHVSPVNTAVLDNHDCFSFDQDAKSMRRVRAQGQQPVQEDQNESNY